MNGSTIVAEGLGRRFGSFEAVKEIDFEVSAGSIFGLLGANGAGKSTTIRMLCGLLRSSSGTGSVAGFDINKEPERIKEHIGYMSQQFSLYRDLTVAENIEFFSGAYGLDRKTMERRRSWVLEMAGLIGRERMLAGELSGGWAQRLALGCSVLHQPSVLFLDEPTGSVDPISRRDFWDLINCLAEEGTTVLVTTHYLDEAEYCSDVCLMHAGSIVAQGSPHSLKSQEVPYTIWRVQTDNPTQAVELLIRNEWVQTASIFGRSVHLGVAQDVPNTDAVISETLSLGRVQFSAVDSISPSLEDVFIRVIQRAEGA